MKSQDIDFLGIEKSIAFLDRGHREPPGLSELAAHLEMSESDT